MKPYLIDSFGMVSASHPTWGVWIETLLIMSVAQVKSSHPTWGVWIETPVRTSRRFSQVVTPHLGCVD